MEKTNATSHAAAAALAVLALALASSGCTIGQTRFALGASLAADAVTTQSALNSSAGAQEGNPVLQKAPVPIMMVLSGVVALVAEKHVRNGDVAKAKRLYRVATAVHTLAAAWNGYQMTNSPGASGGTAALAAKRPIALRLPPSATRQKF